VLGHLLPAMGLDWSHRGIAQLLTNIRANSYLVRRSAPPCAMCLL
jgi:phosphatidate phosphatase PAH1